MAQVLVQNRVAIAQPVLPDVVKAVGVTVKKRSPDILLVVNLYSGDESRTRSEPYFDQLYMSNYATIQLLDALARLKGWATSSPSAGRITACACGSTRTSWRRAIFPPSDVVNVLREQNVQVAAGQIGQPPVPKGQDFQYTMSTLGPADRAGAVRQHHSDDRRRWRSHLSQGRGADRTRRQEPGPESDAGYAGLPSAWRSFSFPARTPWIRPTSIKAKMRELEKRFPQGLKYEIAYDTTPFIHESVGEVFKSLRDAVILVAIVVLLFLQDWKALLLPVIDVGVSLIGTFAVMGLLGFSLEQPDAVRPGAGDRHRGGRRHRRAGEHRALAGKGTARARGHDQGDERNHRPDPGHHAGAELGVSAQRVSRRHHGPVLPPVRPDDRGLDDHLGHQRHDDDSGPGRLDLRRPQAGPAWRRGQRGFALVVLRSGRRNAVRLVAEVDAWRAWLGLPGADAVRKRAPPQPARHASASMCCIWRCSSFPAPLSADVSAGSLSSR